MSTNKKVSVLLPAYKDTYLRQMLDSLMAQTFVDYEIVVVDDASPYDIKRIVDDYKSDKIRYHRNAVNVGKTDLVANWNHLLEYATGEMVVLASDDDVYHPEFIERLVSLSKQYPDVDLFHCRVAVIDENDNPIYWSSAAAEYETDIDFIYQRAVNRRTQLISDFMFRKRALDKIGGFVKYPKAWYSDEMTVYKVAKGKGVVCSSETLFYWRSSQSNISSLHTDVIEKAEASKRHLSSMDEFLQTLTPHDMKDEFLLNRLKQRASIEIRRQLINDMVLSNFKTNLKIFRTYPKLFSKKEKALFAVGKLRKALNF